MVDRSGAGVHMVMMDWRAIRNCGHRYEMRWSVRSDVDERRTTVLSGVFDSVRRRGRGLVINPLPPAPR